MLALPIQSGLLALIRPDVWGDLVLLWKCPCEPAVLGMPACVLALSLVQDLNGSSGVETWSKPGWFFYWHFGWLARRFWSGASVWLLRVTPESQRLVFFLQTEIHRLQQTKTYSNTLSWRLMVMEAVSSREFFFACSFSLVIFTGTAAPTAPQRKSPDRTPPCRLIVLDEIDPKDNSL